MVKQENRLKAIEQGLSTYVGRPCKKCNTTKRYVIDYNCVNCKTEYTRSEKCKAYKRNYKLLNEYNITTEQYNEMVKLQNGECFACSKIPASGHHKKLVVDHDHETGQVRSLLCDNCNRIVGYLHEDIEYAKKLIDYINYCKELRNAYYRKVA